MLIIDNEFRILLSFKVELLLFLMLYFYFVFKGRVMNFIKENFISFPENRVKDKIMTSTDLS